MKPISVLFLFTLMTLSSCKSIESQGAKFKVIEQKIVAQTKFKYKNERTGEIFAESKSNINITYPQIDHWATPTSQAKLNTTIRNYVDQSEKRFVDEGGQPISEDEKVKLEKVAEEDIDYFQTMDMEMTMEYKILTHTDRFVSMELNTYYYTGGAHGTPAFKIINFDAQLTKDITLDDLFINDTDYLKVIAPHCRNTLIARMDQIDSSKDMIEEGTDPLRPENYQIFEVKKEGIEIIFPPYQVAPYVAGAQSVLIPYEKIKSILSQNSVLKSLQSK